MNTEIPSDAARLQRRRDNLARFHREGHPAKLETSKGLDLGSDDNEYYSMYEVVYNWLEERNQISKNPRTSTQRTAIRKELSNYLVQLVAARTPRVADALRSSAGQEALRKLIYQACLNYLRQRQRSKAFDLATKGGISRSHPYQVHTDSNVKEGSGSAPPRSGPRLGPNLLCVERPDGAVRAICSLSELAPSWPEIHSGGGGTEALLNALSLPTLLCILEKDHSYRPCGHRLGIVSYDSQKGANTLILKNERQFRAAIGGLLDHYSIDFKIIDPDPDWDGIS